MCVYEYSSDNDQLLLSERNIYGSSRLGIERVDKIMSQLVFDDINYFDFNLLTVDNTNSAPCANARVISMAEYETPNAYDFNY